MFIKRIFVLLLCTLIAGGGIFYTVTFRLFDRPLSGSKQEEFQEQIHLPDNFTLAASVNSFDTVKNTLQSARKNVNGGSYALELNVTLDEKNVPYLADGPEYITDASVKLETIFKEFQDSTYLRYILQLQNYTTATPLINLAVKYGLIGRIMLTGFSPDDLSEYAPQYGNFRLCVRLDTGSVKMNDQEACSTLLQSYLESGASAVSCKLNDVTDAFCGALAENSRILLVIEDVNSNYEMYQALSFNPNIVITEHPEILYNMMLSQDYLDLNNAGAF